MEPYISLNIEEMVALVRYYLENSDDQFDDWMELGSSEFKDRLDRIRNNFKLIERIMEAAQEELSEMVRSQ